MFGATGHLPELIIILILGLVILGPGKLPQVGGAVGKTIREFRKASTEADEDKAEEGNPEPAPVGSTTAPAPAKPATPPTTVKASGTSAATADKAEL